MRKNPIPANVPAPKVENRAQVKYAPLFERFLLQPEGPAGRKVPNENLKAALGLLSPKESRVLEMRLGLEDGKHHTLEEVGKELSKTGERIRTIEAKALRKLRHPHFTEVLEGRRKPSFSKEDAEGRAAYLGCYGAYPTTGWLAERRLVIQIVETAPKGLFSENEINMLKKCFGIGCSVFKGAESGVSSGAHLQGLIDRFRNFRAFGNESPEMLAFCICHRNACGMFPGPESRKNFTRMKTALQRAPEGLLTEQEGRIIRMRYGFGTDVHSYAQIAAAEKITRSQVGSILGTAERKLDSVQLPST